MHFTYESPDSTDKANLCQGDVLFRTPQLIHLINQLHPYFAEAKYKAYMLLTQSCDLFRRNGRCKAPYLTLAVVRTVEDALRHELNALDETAITLDSESKTMCGHTFVSEKLKDRLTIAATSLFNNNLDGYFFLRADSEAFVGGDWCAFLRVTIPLRVEHYDLLLDAKRAQLRDVFQAKVGWLLGSNYARVATPDWTSSASGIEEQGRLLQGLVHKAHQWIPDKQMTKIRARLKADEVAETEASVRALLDDPSMRIRNRRQLILAAVSEAWPPGKQVDRNRFIGQLQNRPEFREAVASGK